MPTGVYDRTRTRSRKKAKRQTRRLTAADHYQFAAQTAVQRGEVLDLLTNLDAEVQKSLTDLLSAESLLKAMRKGAKR